MSNYARAADQRLPRLDLQPDLHTVPAQCEQHLSLSLRSLQVGLEEVMLDRDCFWLCYVANPTDDAHVLRRFQILHLLQPSPSVPNSRVLGQSPT